MWRMLTRGPYGDVQFALGYDGGAQEYPGSGPVPPLDEIDPEIVGKLRVAHLCATAKKQEKLSLVRVLEEILPEHGSAKDWIGDTKQTKGNRPIDARYADHVESLEKSKLICAAEGTPLHFSGYFAVMKGEDRTRAIFNGKALSERCPVPPTVNLMGITDVVNRMVSHLQQQASPRIHVVMGDFRHWFHQIPAPQHLRRLFGMRSSNPSRLWEWQSLPMGWSWSPVIAQACAWGVLTHNEEGQKAFFDERAFSQKGNQLPSYIATAKGTGWATVYYDNYILVTSDANEADEFSARMLRTCALLGAVIKKDTHKVLKHVDLMGKGFDYLGVHFAFKGNKKACREISWHPASLEKWGEATIPTEGDRTTCRGVAEIVGRAIFCLLLGHRSLRVSHEGRIALEIASTVGRIAARHGWNAEVETPPRLRELWDHILATKNQPFTADLTSVAPKRIEHPEMTLAVDASKTGYGWILFRRESAEWMPLEDAATHSFKWDAEQEKEHIFYLELAAAIAAIQWMRSTRPTVPFRLVVDNSALAFCLTHGFTRSKKGMAMLDDAPGVCEAPAAITLVVTHDNPADCPSRPTYEIEDLEKRITKMSLAIGAEENGWRWSSGKLQDWKGPIDDDDDPRRVRHDGPPDEDDELDAASEGNADESRRPKRGRDGDDI